LKLSSVHWLIAVALLLNACSGGSGFNTLTQSATNTSLGNVQNTPASGISGASTDTNVGSQENSVSGTDTDSNSILLDPLETVSQLTALHRSGQTFITWPEVADNVKYNVYRHDRPITTQNLSNATLLNDRWGGLDSDTSFNKYATHDVPSNFVITDLGAPLSDGTGLFVYTVPETIETLSYYAYTTIINGVENRQVNPNRNALRNPIREIKALPSPVLTASINNGKGRIYTQFMDYSTWNPTLNGYAYSYAVSLPYNYDPRQSYPVQIQLHAFGENYRFLPETEYESEVIQISPSDPGFDQNTIHSWWYGYSSSHNYQVDGSIPASGPIENFTEQRVLLALQQVIANTEINTNTELVHIIGHSMGASGALSFGMRYPSIIAGIYASQPMTNYVSSPIFQENFIQLWGTKSRNFPIINNGTFNQSIQPYDLRGTKPTRVWNWMNHIEQLRLRGADDFAYLMIDHGKADTTIDWKTQGEPLASALTDAKVGFSANAFEGVGHSWLSFGAVIKQLFGLGYADEYAWRYPNTLSFPSITNATGSSSINPTMEGNSSFNMDIEWSTEKNAFDEEIVDTATEYQISIRSTGVDQFANITPRNTQFFRPSPGRQCNWSVVRNSGRQMLQRGSVTVDSAGLVTANRINIPTGSGIRLTITC